MTIKQLYPTVRPTLDLNFAQTKRLDPRVTFSRSSSGTYFDNTGVLSSATTNQARFDHDPTTGESLGLLVEEARTNLVTYSEQFDNAAWNKVGASVTPNAVVSPDGTTNADQITGDGLAGAKNVASTMDATADIFWQHTCFLKAGTHSIVQLAVGGINDIFANFDLGSGTVGDYGASSLMRTPTITKLANGWYRCHISFDLTSAGSSKNPAPIIALVSSSSAARGESNSISGSVYAYGFQVEQGSYPTSYIPTTSSTVTRAADVASITGTNFSSWYNQSEGTLFADTTDLGYPINALGSLWKIFASTSHASGRNSVFLMRYSGGALPEARFGIVDQNAIAVVDLNTTAPPTSARVKSAIGLKSASYAATSHGNTVVTSSAAVPPTYVAADTLAFGQATSTTSQVKSCLISRLTYYPVRLPDATLQTLTL